jgi:hypothetical protein
MSKSFVCRSLAAVLLILSAVSGQAAIEQSQLSRLALDIWRIRADFHMFTVMTGNDRYQSQLEESISRGEETMAEIMDSAESEAEMALVESLAEEWDQYIEYARSNSIVELGYTDHYTVLDMSASRNQLMDSIREYQGAEEDEFADLVSLGADLQQMASEYLQLAADPSGGSTIGGANKLEFQKAVPAFDEKLEKLKEQYSDNKAVSRTLRQVSLRWRFIRDSLVNFSENSVPFLVHRYSHEMTEELALATMVSGMEEMKPPTMPGAGAGDAPPVPAGVPAS